MPTQHATQQDLRNLYSEVIRSAASREVEKLIKLLYQSIGVNPYDEYGNLRPDEDILSDLIAANLKIDISIDDIIGG